MPSNQELSPTVGEILEVLQLVEDESPLTLARIGVARAKAVKQVAQQRGTDPRSVADQCWRRLGLASMAKFDDLIWAWLNRSDEDLKSAILANLTSEGSDTDKAEVERFFGRDRGLNVWWVNQGATWKEETAGGYVWAPRANKAGGFQGHHHSVRRLRRGDLIFNHWDTAIRGVSVVVVDGTEGARPSELPSGLWESDGFIGKVEFKSLNDPIPTQEIPTEWRRREPHAFNSSGGTNQVYLVPLTQNFWAGLATSFADRLPSDAIAKLNRERLVSFMLAEFQAETFDETERNYKLEIAERVTKFFNESDPTQFHSRFKQIFDPPNNLINWRTTSPLIKAVSNENLSDLIEFKYQIDREPDDPELHVSILDDLIEGFGVDIPPADRLRIASLLLSSLATQDHVLVMSSMFENLEKAVGFGVPDQTDVKTRYLHHLEFAEGIRRELTDRGAEIRDMIDVQSLLFIASNNKSKWTGNPMEQHLSAAPEHSRLEPVTRRDVAAETFMTEEAVNEICRLIDYKRHVVFEGPPGSGKTFVAQKIARYLTGNQLDGDVNDRMAVVQFHQSYGYEDFVQGIRPLTGDDGQIKYELRAGVFRDLCERARIDPDNTYVLLIDEINRGNISRILGELLYLLEYRDQSVRLAYSEESDGQFSIPENVVVLGTMNTTDRSLTQIDYALRRRFYFYRFMPTESDEAPVLQRWSDNAGLDPDFKSMLLGVFLKLNRRLTDRLDEHFQIGHSYFMRIDIEDAEVLDEVFRWSVLPLVEEYFFNVPDRQSILDEFTLSAIRGAL